VRWLGLLWGRLGGDRLPDRAFPLGRLPFLGRLEDRRVPGRRLVAWRRLVTVGVVGPARGWLLGTLLVQVALGPARAVVRRARIAHASPPAARLIAAMITERAEALNLLIYYDKQR
jgi:hypothetical protein